MRKRVTGVGSQRAALICIVLGGVIGLFLPIWCYAVHLTRTAQDTLPQVLNVGTFESTSCRRTVTLVFACPGEVEWDNDPVQDGHRIVEDVTVRSPTRLIKPTRIEWRQIERGSDELAKDVFIPEGTKQGQAGAEALVVLAASISGVIGGPVVGNLFASFMGWDDFWLGRKPWKAKSRSQKIPRLPLK